MDFVKKFGLAISVSIAAILSSAYIHMHPYNLHEGEILWNHGHGDAIQGLYSKLDCSSQPGTRPWFVDAENHSFFMGCRP